VALAEQEDNMRLFELDSVNPLITKLVAVTDQLQSDLEDGKKDPSMTVEELLNYFQQYDIVLDKPDLYNMIEKPPLKRLIRNIKNNEVIFKGFGAPETPNDDNQKVVKSMANKAARNLK